MQDLKLKYYDMMIQFALHLSSYLDAAKYYHKIWETPSIKEDEKGRGREVSLYQADISFPHLTLFRIGSRTHCLLHCPRTPR